MKKKNRSGIYEKIKRIGYLIVYMFISKTKIGALKYIVHVYFLKIKKAE